MAEIDPERPQMSDGCFLVIWGYLMVLVIVLAPVIATIVRKTYS